jgi:hypothetical protein
MYDKKDDFIYVLRKYEKKEIKNKYKNREADDIIDKTDFTNVSEEGYAAWHGV